MKKVLFTFGAAILLSLQLRAQDVPVADSAWKIHGENTFLINQSSFSNWAAGGNNAFAANLVFNYDFNYAKDKWSWDNKVIAGYGLSKQEETGWRKNDDRVILNSLLGYKAAEHWLYTFFMNFNTQFAKGYEYNDDNNTKKVISGAFAPAYLSFGPGFAYKKSDNFRFNLSPAAARFVFVGIDSLATKYGLDPGKSSRFEFGASFDAYYKVDIMQNVALENILKLYSNYTEKPQNVDVDYTLNLFMKVNKFISVNAGVQLLYDDNTKFTPENSSIPGGARLQVKQIVGAGFTYKF
ncbi:Protein of unknown function [bacterium A37T11]|nr:Protein of unknown function [bacterium A37T11]